MAARCAEHPSKLLSSLWCNPQCSEQYRAKRVISIAVVFKICLLESDLNICSKALINSFWLLNALHCILELTCTFDMHVAIKPSGSAQVRISSEDLGT